MRNLNYELKQMCQRNCDGSYATQRDRARVLDLVANQLQELGYRHLAATSLKPKHVEALLARWQTEGLAVGTIKYRMAELRWWAEKIGKQNVIARENHQYGIGNRQYVTNVSRARELSDVELSRITDPYSAMSLRLWVYGLVSQRIAAVRRRPTVSAGTEPAGARNLESGRRKRKPPATHAPGHACMRATLWLARMFR